MVSSVRISFSRVSVRIFVLDPDGKKAYRRSIKIGRQNPQYYEVLEGLEAGEKVIVSSYESYKDNEVLVLE